MLYKRSLQDDSGEIIDAIKDSLYDVPTNIYMSCLRVTTQNFKQSFKLLIIQKERLWERLRKYLMDKVTKTTWRLECSQKEKTTFTIFFFFFFSIYNFSACKVSLLTRSDNIAVSNIKRHSKGCVYEGQVGCIW